MLNMQGNMPTYDINAPVMSRVPALPISPPNLSGFNQLMSMQYQNPAYQMISQAVPTVVQALNNPKVTPALVMYGTNLLAHLINAQNQKQAQELTAMSSLANTYANSLKELSALYQVDPKARDDYMLRIKDIIEGLSALQQAFHGRIGIPLPQPQPQPQQPVSQKQPAPTRKTFISPLNAPIDISQEALEGNVFFSHFD